MGEKELDALHPAQHDCQVQGRVPVHVSAVRAVLRNIITLKSLISYTAKKVTVNLYTWVDLSEDIVNQVD